MSHYNMLKQTRSRARHASKFNKLDVTNLLKTIIP